VAIRLLYLERSAEKPDIGKKGKGSIAGVADITGVNVLSGSALEGDGCRRKSLLDVRQKLGRQEAHGGLFKRGKIS